MSAAAMQTITAPVRMEVVEGIAKIVFDRPQALNAINIESAQAFLTMCEQLQRNMDIFPDRTILKRRCSPASTFAKPFHHQ